MLVAKQMEIRDNIKKYFDIAYEGNAVVVPRKQNKNIVIISEEEYNRLSMLKRTAAYSGLIAAELGKEKQAAQTHSAIKDDNLKKLEDISNLEDGWNGNGAPKFQSSLIKRVRALLKAMAIQPEIFPTAMQTIQFEFDNSRHDHMEIEIGESDVAEIYVAPYDGKDYFEKIQPTALAINERVSAFYG